MDAGAVQKYCTDTNAIQIYHWENKEQRFYLKNAIKKIACKSLNELATSLLFTGITCFFVASPALPGLLVITISVIAFNAIVRSLEALFIYELEHREKIENNEWVIRSLKFCNAILPFLSPMSFTLLDETTRGILIHEAGHAIAATAVYENANVTVQVSPLSGGVTHFQTSTLTEFGHWLGRENSRILVSAAGPALGVFSASIHIGLSHYLKDSHPELSRYFLVTGISSIAHLAFYALSALGSNLSKGHDFGFLYQTANIHPIFAAITIIAIPMLVKGSLALIDYYRSKTISKQLGSPTDGMKGPECFQ